MTVTIEIPEERVAVLKAKAAAQGLTLEEWLQKLVDQGLEVEQPSQAVQIRVRPPSQIWPSSIC